MNNRIQRTILKIRYIIISINQSINQTKDQSIWQWIDESINQSINQLINESDDESVTHLIEQSIDQPEKNMTKINNRDFLTLPFVREHAVEKRHRPNRR